MIATILLTASLGLNAQVRTGSPADTVKAAEMLSALRSDQDRQTGHLAARGALMLCGTPSGTAPDNDSVATVKVDFSAIDRLGVLNTSLALAKGAQSQLGRWQDYGEAMVEVSRRRGVDKGFPSKMIYGADWINDNVYRGNVTELTERYSSSNIFKTKSLDAVSYNRQDYPAMADSTVYEAVRMVEMGFRTHKIPHLKKETINKKEILSAMKDGDIIMMLGPDIRYDLYDCGIVVVRDDGPHLVHVSASEGKVVEEADPLPRYFKKENQYFYGYRWLRPSE